jgi:uncharacterized protein
MIATPAAGLHEQKNPAAAVTRTVSAASFFPEAVRNMTWKGVVVKFRSRSLPLWVSVVLLGVLLLSPPVLWGARAWRGPGPQERLEAGVESRDALAVRLAIGAGADVNKADAWGDTPATRAATLADPAVLIELLARGADPNGSPTSHPTPLMLALPVGNIRNAAILLRAGADPNRSSRGIAPLIVATYRSDDLAIRMLLEAGADPNGTPDCGRLPLIQAIENPESPASMLELLLEAGADPDAADAQGRTARQVAARIGRADAAALLSLQASARR